MPSRTGGPLLRVVDLLMQAGTEWELHGWLIMKTTKLTGPSVYRALDQLENWGWVEARWEPAESVGSKPRTRLYRLKPSAVASAQALLEELAKPSTAPRRKASPRPGFAQLALPLRFHGG